MGYFDHPYASNSAFSALKKELSGEESTNPYNNYRIGSLVDGVITEKELIDRIRMVIVGTDYTFTPAELKSADVMDKRFHAHPLCSQIYKTSKRQVELYVENVRFEYNGVVFYLNMKCKYDFYSQTLITDLKSTSATTQEQFEAACEKFDYWRQIALYGKLGNVRRAIIIGISKINYKVFIVQLKYGDERWTKGLNQLNKLAFKYWALKN